jgi:hypothetical protein
MHYSENAFCSKGSKRNLNSLFVIIYLLRAFPTHFASILYFTPSKSHFSILTTHFYKTPHIPFSILQYIILKYYKIIFFIYIYFFTLQPNPRQPSKPQESINHNLNNPINSLDQQPSTSQINNPASRNYPGQIGHHRSHHSQQPPKTHSRLLNHGNHS